MLKKAKDWIGDNLDLYVEQDASNVISGGIKHVWNPNIGLSQEGTKIDADLINMIQKNGVLTVNGIRQPNSAKDVYLVQINGFEEFGIYEGMKLVVEFDQTNITDLVYLSLNNIEYELQSIIKNDIAVGKEYFIQFKNNKFELVTNKFGTITGTTLEGNQLAKIMGVDQSKIGALISTPGTKVAGNVYFDTISSSYYLCLETNTGATVTSDFANLSAISQYNRIKSYTIGGAGVWKVLEIDTKIEVTINFNGVPIFAGASALGGFEYTYGLTLPFALKQGKVFAEITNDITGTGEHISSLVYDKTSTTTVLIRFISPSNTLSNVNISVLLKGEK